MIAKTIYNMIVFDDSRGLVGRVVQDMKPRLAVSIMKRVVKEVCEDGAAVM